MRGRNDLAGTAHRGIFLSSEGDLEDVFHFHVNDGGVTILDAVGKGELSRVSIKDCPGDKFHGRTLRGVMGGGEAKGFGLGADGIGWLILKDDEGMAICIPGSGRTVGSILVGGHGVVEVEVANGEEVVRTGVSEVNGVDVIVESFIFRTDQLPTVEVVSVVGWHTPADVHGISEPVEKRKRGIVIAIPHDPKVSAAVNDSAPVGEVRMVDGVQLSADPRGLFIYCEIKPHDPPFRVPFPCIADERIVHGTC